MRRFAPACALARASMWVLALVCTVPTQAQEAAAPVAQAAPSSDAQATTPRSPPIGVQDRREQLFRRSNSYLGPVGGIHVIEAGSGAPGSFRLQVFTDFFFKDDYLYEGDDTRYVGGSLSLGITPIEHLELSAAVTTRNLRNSLTEPEVVRSIGDPSLNVKTYGSVARGVTLGGDVTLQFLTAPSSATVDYAGTSVGLRGNLSLDLREMPARVPLELRFNAGYLFDQSEKVIENLERDRLADLRAQGLTADPTGRAEYRHLALREERFTYAVNRVDHASIAVGLEAPLKVSRNVALHPLAEWELWIPVNRQDYDCSRLRLPTGERIPGDDSCLDDESAGSFPQRVTLGARIYPALPGLSLLAAVEIGIGHTDDFVRELAPVAPYRVMLAASYAVDLAPRVADPRVQEIERRVEVAAKEGHVRGTVVEQGPATPVGDARVAFTGRDLSQVLTDGQGRFVSYAFPPGPVDMGIEAEGYRPGTCAAAIPSEGGDVSATCELVALPRVGSLAARLLDANGAPVVGATIALTGPTSRSPVSDSDGRIREQELPPGDYQAHVEHEGYLISNTPLRVDARKESTVQIQLLPKPKQPLVRIEKTRLRLSGAIYFNTDTSEIQQRSFPLLTEIADVLLRTPAIRKVEVQGHTDNVGAAEHNLMLSQQRAEAVRDWLVRAGVEADRLGATGFGLTKPVGTNATAAGRARNRRVEFVIVERAQPEAAAPKAPAPQ